MISHGMRLVLGESGKKIIVHVHWFHMLWLD